MKSKLVLNFFANIVYIIITIVTITMSDLFVSQEDQEVKITNDLFVDVKNDPPLEPRIVELLARSPYHPDDRNTLLRRGFESSHDKHPKSHSSRPRSQSRPEYLRDLDIYGGGDGTFECYMGGQDSESLYDAYEYEDGTDVSVAANPVAWFELVDE